MGIDRKGKENGSYRIPEKFALEESDG